MTVIRPENFKEQLVMALPNCTTMVLGMMTINLWIYGALTPIHFLVALPKIYITAFVLDFFFVGPVVMGFVMRHNIVKYMPFIRVGIMAGILTFIAPILETGIIPS